MTALVTLWVSAVTVATLGSWLLFDASLGVNWSIWTLVASASLVVCSGHGERRVPAAIWPPLVLACALAAGAPLTANPAFAALPAFELRERPAVQRLLRRAMGLSLAAVAALGCWNHEAWIAWWNIDRAVETGRLDPGYLV